MEYVEKLAKLQIGIEWKDGQLYSWYKSKEGGFGVHFETYEDRTESKVKAIIDTIEFWDWLLSI